MYDVQFTRTIVHPVNMWVFIFIITDFLLQDCFKTVKENLVLYLLITIKLFIFLSRSFYYIHTLIES